MSADMLWAACVIAHDLLDRADAAVAGGFGTMSALCSDLLTLDRQGTDLPGAARELQARGVRVSALDPFLAWYPGWQPAPGSGPHVESQNIDEDTVLRFADAVGAESMTVLTPFSGAAAALPAVVDALGGFGDRAAAHGLRLHLEVIPTSKVPDLATGWEIVRQVGRDNVGLVLDLFHLARARTDPALLRTVPAEKIFHVQLCDGSLVPRVPDYFEEAVTLRDFAGEGELPVTELAQCLADMGALGHVGPEVFSPELDRLPAVEAGRVCRAKTDAFLATLTLQQADQADGVQSTNCQLPWSKMLGAGHGTCCGKGRPDHRGSPRAGAFARRYTGPRGRRHPRYRRSRRR